MAPEYKCCASTLLFTATEREDTNKNKRDSSMTDRLYTPTYGSFFNTLDGLATFGSLYLYAFVWDPVNPAIFAIFFLTHLACIVVQYHMDIPGSIRQYDMSRSAGLGVGLGIYRTYVSMLFLTLLVGDVPLVVKAVGALTSKTAATITFMSIAALSMFFTTARFLQAAYSTELTQHTALSWHSLPMRKSQQ